MNNVFTNGEYVIPFDGLREIFKKHSMAIPALINNMGNCGMEDYKVNKDGMLLYDDDDPEDPCELIGYSFDIGAEYQKKYQSMDNLACLVIQWTGFWRDSDKQEYHVDSRYIKHYDRYQWLWDNVYADCEDLGMGSHQDSWQYEAAQHFVKYRSDSQMDHGHVNFHLPLDMMNLFWNQGWLEDYAVDQAYYLEWKDRPKSLHKNCFPESQEGTGFKINQPYGYIWRELEQHFVVEVIDKRKKLEIVEDKDGMWHGKSKIRDEWKGKNSPNIRIDLREGESEHK